MLTQAQLQEQLDKSPSDIRVSKEMIDSRIKSTDFSRLPRSTVTVCNITLDNGFSVRGESACVDPKNFNEDIGQTLAYDDAYGKLWPLFGFLLADIRYRATLQQEEESILDTLEQQGL